MVVLWSECVIVAGCTCVVFEVVHALVWVCVSLSLRESVCVSPWVWVSVGVCVTCENLCASVEVFL